MNRKIISALLALVLCFSLALTATAAPVTDFVIDEFGYLTAEEVDSLNDLGAAIYDETGVGIIFAYVDTESVTDYDVSALVGGMTDYLVMLENETHWYIHLGGRAESLTEDDEDALRAVYDEEDTYVGGVEAFLEAAAEYFPYIADTPEGDILEVEEVFLYDDADLLSDKEEAELTEKLAQISYKHNAQIVISTVESLGGDVDDYLNFTYDDMGFGYGDEYDGVFLLVCMDPREYRILSNGFAGVAIDPGDIDSIGEIIVSDLSDGNYADAFDSFIDECDYYLDGYLNGFPFRFGKNLIIAAIIGLLIGAVVASILKGQLKSVRKQEQANVYVKQDSMQITNQSDIFLYRHVSRSKKSSSSSSSSGGSSRSTGGGSF